MEAGIVIENASGIFGRWHLMLIIAIYLSKFAISCQQLAMLVEAPRSSFTCSNDSMNKCDKDCPEHVFNRSIFKETIITQWDLVCENEYLDVISHSIVMFGVLVGNVFFGYLADKCGRKYVLAVSVTIQTAASIAVAFAPWYWLYIVLQAFSTISIGGSMIITFVILMEYTAHDLRSIIGALYQMPAYIGFTILGTIAWCFPEWHNIQLIISVPQVILLLYWCILPESPRWLLMTGRTEAAVTMLTRAAKCNKLPTDNIRSEIEAFGVFRSKQPPIRTGSIADLFKTKRMRSKTLTLALNWFVLGFGYFSMGQYIGIIKGNIFLNIIISGVMQIPGPFFIIAVMSRYGRKFALIVCYIIMLAPCFLTAAVPKAMVWPTIMCVAITMLGIAACFTVLYVYSVELLPTVCRCFGMGLLSAAARMGGMLAPSVIYLQDMDMPWLLPLIVGILPFFSSVITFIVLPETVNVEMPDTVEHADDL